MSQIDLPATIGAICRTNAERFADREAVVDAERRFGWAALTERTNRLANALGEHLGVRVGDRVAFIGDNCIEGFELMHASPRAGFVAVPLNNRLAPAELVAIGQSATPRVVLHTSAEREVAERLAATCSAELVEIGPGGSGAQSYDALLVAGSTATPSHVEHERDVCSICFTSGTTGTPKGVLMLNGAQVAFAHAQRVIEPIRDRARHLFVRPMSVAPGHRFAAWHGVYGGTTVLAQRFDPEEFFRSVAAERVTNVLLAPTLFRMLLDHGNPEGHALDSLEAIVYGGAPMSPALLAEVTQFFGCGLMEGYGSSEAGQVLYRSAQMHRDHPDRHVALPVPGVEVELRQRGADAGDEDEGELCVRSTQLFGGYWGNPEGTKAALEGGWYRTGDLARRDVDGTYAVVGRTKDMIISGGFNVIPTEVENVIAAHPGVREVAVFGVPHRVWGEAVEAAVVRRVGFDVSSDDVVSWCRERLASFKKPTIVHFVDELPKTSAGKIDVRRLRTAHSAPSGAPDQT